MTAWVFGFYFERRGPLAAICFHRGPRKTMRWIQEPSSIILSCGATQRAGWSGQKSLEERRPRPSPPTAQRSEADTLSFTICSGTITRVSFFQTKMLLGGGGGGEGGGRVPCDFDSGPLASGPQQSWLHYCMDHLLGPFKINGSYCPLTSETA